MRRWLLVILLATPLAVLAQFNTKRMLEMGKNALYYDDYLLSIRRFNAVISARPNLGEAYYYRALAKFYLSDYHGADADATSALEWNPYIENLLPLRAICRVNMKHFADAEEDYQSITQSRPHDAMSWNNLVMCQIEQRAYARADSTLRQMMVRFPDRADFRDLSSQVRDILDHKSQDMEAPQVHYDSRYQTRSTMTQQDMLVLPPYVLTYFPNQEPAIEYDAFYKPLEDLNLMEILLVHTTLTTEDGPLWEGTDQKIARDIQVLNRMIEEHDRLPSLLFRRAVDHYHLRDFDSAIADMDELLSEDTIDVLPYFFRAQIRCAELMAGQADRLLYFSPTEARIGYTRALDDLTRAIALDPEFAFAYYNRGCIYMALRDFDRADAEFSRALELHPGLPVALYNRGVERLQCNRVEEGLQDLGKAGENGVYIVYKIIQSYKGKRL